MLGILQLLTIVSAMGPPNRAATYIRMASHPFLRSYARGFYEDAAMWSRRIAEAFCIMILRDHFRMKELDGLYDMINAIPWEVSNEGVYKHLQGDLVLLGTEMGCGLTSQKVWQDLHTMRRYGNQGAHPFEYFDDGPLKPDAQVFVATLRIIMCFAAWHRRTYIPMSRL